MNLRATVDIGSNSVLLVAGDFSSGYKELLNESRVTGLGRELDKNKAFIQEAMDETFEALNEFKDLCQKIKIPVENIIVTATEASRVAKNAQDFFLKVKKEIGMSVTIIDSKGEAYYSAHGIMFNAEIKDEKVYIMDIGGASTEIIELETKNKKILSSFSMPMGSVRVSTWLKENCAEDYIQDIFQKFSKELDHVKTSRLYCVAGTMTSLANMHLKCKSFEEDKVHGLVMSISEVQKVKSDYFKMSQEEVLKLFPFLGKRSRSIHGGMYMVNEIFKRVPVKEVCISTYGLRYGTMDLRKIDDQFIVWKA